MSGLTEAQVLCVPVQEEFNERQSGKQDVDILIEDACERCKHAGKGLYSRIKGYNFIIHMSGGGGKDC